MFRTVFSLLGFLSVLPLHTQDGIAAGSEDRAAELRSCSGTRLPLEPAPLAFRLLRAAALGTVSSLAAGRDGVIYVLALRNGGHQKTLVLGVPSQTPALF